MSDAEFLGYAGSLAAAGLLFLILAVFGFGQAVVLRVLDVLVGLAFLGYAGYLMVVAPDDPFMSWLVFVTPVIGLAVALTARRRARSRLRRLEEEHSAKPYAGQEPAVNKERQPYPSPPAPLDPSEPAPARKPPGPAARPAGLPSGLPDTPPPSGLGESPLEAAPRPPRPSGLPQAHAEPGESSPLAGWPSPAHATPSHASPSPASPSHASPSHASPSHASPSHASPSHSESAAAGYRARHGTGDDETAQHDYSGGRHRADGEF